MAKTKQKRTVDKVTESRLGTVKTIILGKHSRIAPLQNTIMKIRGCKERSFEETMTAMTRAKDQRRVEELCIEATLKATSMQERERLCNALVAKSNKTLNVNLPMEIANRLQIEHPNNPSAQAVDYTLSRALVPTTEEQEEITDRN